jgi:hypothetical protein
MLRYFLAASALMVNPALSQTATSAKIHPPIIAAKPKDFGGSGRIANGSAKNVHALRAMVAFPLRQTASTIVIKDVIVGAARDFVAPEKGKPTTINNVTIERVEARVAKRGIYIRGDSTDWGIRDFRFIGSAPRTDSSIPAGIAINGTAHNIVIERGYLANFRTNWLAGRYANGDCVSTERGNFNVTIRGVVCEHPSDGGFDLKSSNTRLDDLSVTNSGHYSYRLWAQGTAGTLTSIDPFWGHVQAASRTTDWVIDKLIAVGDKPLVVFGEAGGKIEVRSCDLSRWTGTEKVKGTGTVTFGATCAGPLRQVNRAIKPTVRPSTGDPVIS